uniref:Reverse transcriptase domain-containing protein n=1 Tax=Schistocephalus solidus TaxID=70667 RepID=A0A0X3P1E6_SCHSO
MVPSSLYEFNVMPFALANAQATLHVLITTVWHDIISAACLIYLDDIILHGKTVDERNTHLREVLLRLRDAGLVLHIYKCKLLQNQTLFLGYILSALGVQPDPHKISRIFEWPTPKTSQEIRSFFGLACYSWEFIHGVTGIAAPLHRLIEKSRAFLWTKECELTFAQLKRAVTFHPVLSLSDISESAREFILDTDASNTVIGAILFQFTAYDEERAITFAAL